jgi:hypothetical protein
LSDLDNTETVDEEGYVAIVPTEDGQWGVRFVIADERGRGWHKDNLLFVTYSLEEAKRHVDMVIGFDSGEIPLFGDSDPK